MDAILYGECVGSRDVAMVRICALANEGCDIETDGPAAVLDSDFSLWIGAMGPFAASAAGRHADRVVVRFKEPLDGRILDHFRH